MNIIHIFIFLPGFDKRREVHIPEIICNRNFLCRDLILYNHDNHDLCSLQMTMASTSGAGPKVSRAGCVGGNVPVRWGVQGKAVSRKDDPRSVFLCLQHRC